MIGYRKSTVSGSERGAAALEYGLLLPVLISIVLGAMDAGRLMWTYTTLHRAVEASARCASINSSACGTVAQIADRAADEAWGLGLTAQNFTVQVQSCGTQVTANYQFPMLIPWFDQTGPQEPSGAITLSASACYPL